MGYLDYNEPILHRTGDLPLAYYEVDARHPRYSMRMHWHRETELLFVREGVLHMVLERDALDVRAGELIVLGGGVLHGGEPENCAYECIVFDPAAILVVPEACRSALSRVLGCTFKPDLTDPALSSAAAALFSAAHSGTPAGLLQLIGALQMLFGLMTAEPPAPLLLTDASRAGALLRPALEYIERNYASRITLEELSRQAGLSVKYFCRCFRALTHRSPIDYINYYRIECACALLAETDMTVAEIAQRCGFNDSSFFIKTFRKYKGTTPNRTRN